MATIHVNIGEVKVARRGCLKATLGSCVGIGLFYPDKQIFGLAHVLLPRELGTVTGVNDTREAGAAIQTLLKRMRIEKDTIRHISGGLRRGGQHVSGKSPPS